MTPRLMLIVMISFSLRFILRFQTKIQGKMAKKKSTMTQRTGKEKGSVSACFLVVLPLFLFQFEFDGILERVRETDTKRGREEEERTWRKTHCRA